MGLNSKNLKNADLCKFLSRIDNDLKTGAIMDNALIHIETYHYDVNLVDLEERDVKEASSFNYGIPIEKLVEDVIKDNREYIAAILADDDGGEDLIISKEYKHNIGYGYFRENRSELEYVKAASVVLTQDKGTVRVKTAYPVK